mgnify:CR=1 FL=1
MTERTSGRRRTRPPVPAVVPGGRREILAWVQRKVQRLPVRQTDSPQGLLAPGTLFNTAYRLALPPGSDLAALERVAEARLRAQGVRWLATGDAALG